MKKFASIITVVSALYAPYLMAAQAPFTNFYFFGDSLSDIGNQAGVRNNGSFWVQFLTKRFGVNLQASNSGGTDWANSGARTYTYGGISGLTSQVSNYLATGAINSRGLYSIWAGANDLNALLNGTPVSSVVALGVGNTAASVQLLHNAGANYIMVLNLPDLGITPAFRTSPYSSSLTQVTTLYNATLAQTMNNMGYRIMQVDINSTFNAIVANPARYGFTNVTDEYRLAPAGTDASTYLFYDDRHPTEAGSQLIYDAVMSDLQGAANAAALADTPMATGLAVNSALSNELLAVRTGGQKLAEGRFRAFVTGLYSPTLLDTQAVNLTGYRQSDTGLMAGVDYRLNANVVLGTAISHTASRINFSGPGGSFKMDENLWSVFAGYNQGRLYANGLASIGMIDYRNINRNIPLYRAVDVATGQTTGTHLNAQAEAGYSVFDDKVKSGPFVTVNYQYVDVAGYAESSATTGRNLRYYRIFNDSLVTGLGWQVIYPTLMQNNRVTPYAQLSYNKEWLRNKNSRNGVREIEAGPVSIPGSRGVIPIAEWDNNGWLLANVGVNAQFNKYVYGSLGVQATMLKRPYRTYSVIASLQMPL